MSKNEQQEELRREALARAQERLFTIRSELDVINRVIDRLTLGRPAMRAGSAAGSELQLIGDLLGLSRPRGRRR